MVIVIDNREQKPWSFPPEAATLVRGTLKAGDYALEGDEHFAIERKSLDDLAGTLSTGWDRFKRELFRMSENGFPARIVIVEGTWWDIMEHRYNHPRVLPRFLRKRLAQLAMMGVQVLYAGDCHMAAGMAWVILREREKNLKELGEAGSPSSPREP